MPSPEMPQDRCAPSQDLPHSCAGPSWGRRWQWSLDRHKEGRLDRVQVPGDRKVG